MITIDDFQCVAELPLFLVPTNSGRVSLQLCRDLRLYIRVMEDFSILKLKNILFQILKLFLTYSL